MRLRHERFGGVLKNSAKDYSDRKATIGLTRDGAADARLRSIPRLGWACCPCLMTQ